ncbi:P-loop containing nucleoside triphosphate hydrolase protein [Rhizoclosmatium globosum]|uniref:p-loop containing nucleoside triphosphate hydrolase protein n=1 Tax=Rhizoclosmatium globosum TaxID=329046 RepID=A0A1Y2C059_9FUNG|nr:P-loop containing nucleoside triphosphate hydrolase protein [Rhizoclosmatium globosum]|eukprot:ORY40399.1 P-loop containing nucleoside triphosphate hydrolase protein [Rhizoclosmatium globosum]
MVASKEAEHLQVSETSAGPCPKSNASWLDRLAFSWVNSLFKKGAKKPLVISDLWDIPENIACQDLAEQFEAAWAIELKKFKEQQAKDGGGKAYEVDGTLLKRTLWALCFRQVFPLGFLKVFSDLCNLFSPFLVQYIILYIQQKATSSPGTGVGYALGLFVLQILATFTLNTFTQELAVHAIAMRTAITAIIYRKSIKLSASARQKFDAGTVINMVSTDSARVEQFFNVINFIWTIPIMVAINMIFLIHSLGWAALVGMGMLVIALPIQTHLFTKMKAIRRDQAPITDERVKKTTEILNGVRVIKLFSWETSFVEMVQLIRKRELKLVLRRALYQSTVMTQAQALPILTSCASFIAYSAINPTLDPAYIFSSLAWFQQLRQPIWMLPNILNAWSEFSVAVVRVEGLLLATELDERPAAYELPDGNAVVVKDGNFDWRGPVFIDGVVPSKVSKKGKKKRSSKKGKANGKEEVVKIETPSSSTLKNINLEIPKGSLVAIVGAVGSGKSSLLNALVGEMKRISGTVEFSGSISYSPQTAWIQNASVRENITFGSQFDAERYYQVIYDSALLPDLKVLTDADQTSIGERGINLSGGQKQRINLARLMYSLSDIVLLDDPLSAVDAHVGRHLFNNCIKGSLKSRTRLLVTHQLHFLPECDYILFLKDGEIVERGTYQELLDAKRDFAAMISVHGSEQQDTVEEETGVKDISDALKEIEVLVSTEKAAKDIMRVEDQETGSVKGAVWFRYMQAAGGSGFVIQLAFLVLMVQGCYVGNNLWLAAWTSHDFDLTQLQYIGIYAGIGLGFAASLFAYAIFFGYTGATAAKTLHEKALARVLRCPVYFFDTTPLGRIINRFSRDVDAVDNSIALNFRQLVQQLSVTISTFIVMCYALPIFTAPVIPALGIYYYVQNVYRKTARELKRLDSTTKSPLYANFGETILGISTIRAYSDERRFIARNDHVTDVTNSPYFLLVTCQNWLSIRLQFIGSVLVLFAAMFGIFSNTITASLLGLCLSYSLTVTQTLAMAVQNFTQTEIAMNSVERVEHYAYRLESEAEPVIPDHRPPSENWPEMGVIEFKDVTMRYAPNLPIVLDAISFKIGNGEKVGIVGRTGSGKSTLMQALFRMTEPSSGSMIIDGVETEKLGLLDLRKALAIIPQDAVVFSGTFRSNMDPFSEHTDNELWDALNRAGLAAKVKRSEGKLDAPVDAGGENLSVGERQLLCLSRAMLKTPKILIMDEATANVDFETDAMIQKSLREDFKNSTVLTIAHRLNTIMDYDRVMVLDKGKLCEFDSPRNLLANPNSIFAALVAQTGENNAEVLKKMVL